MGTVLFTDLRDMPDPPSPTYTPPAATVTPDRCMGVWVYGCMKEGGRVR